MTNPPVPASHSPPAPAATFHLSVRRAALVSALIALLVYLPALGNRFALDDGAIVERNPVAHSVAAALNAFGHPYWPPEHGAGLWRPVVILSFAADWQLSGGSPAWLHAVNVMLHAAVTALVVFAIAPYATAAGALAGGVLFAIHPVHVEAVANLVGRAELLVALGLLAALLLARAARRAGAEGRRAIGLEAAALLAVLFALLSKEHAVVAIALLWLDDRARDAEPGRLRPSFFAAVAALTLGWLVVRRAVEGGLSFEAVAPTFFQLGTLGRLSTMLPAVLVVLRLLVWPFDLSPDYHPLVIERLEHPTLTGAIGLVVLAATVALAVLLWRRHRAAALGLLVIGVAWLPTSNLFFPTGIVLAERTLYLPTVGVALLAALGTDALVRRRVRTAVPLMIAASLPLAWTTLTRVPVWRSTRDLVIAALTAHPESYKVHQSAARVLWRLGLREEALAEYRVADEIYGLDPYLLSEMASGLLEAGHPRAALRVLVRSERLDARSALAQQLLAQAYLRTDSAVAGLAHARRAVALAPDKPEPARMLAASFLALGERDSALAVWPAFLARGGSPFERWLIGAVTYATVGQPDSARQALDRAAALLPADTVARRRLGEAREEARRLGATHP